MINRLRCWLWGHTLDFKNYRDIWLEDFPRKTDRPNVRHFYCQRCKRFVRV